MGYSPPRTRKPARNAKVGGTEYVSLPQAVVRVFRERYPLLFDKPSADDVTFYMKAMDTEAKAQAAVAKVTPAIP